MGILEQADNIIRQLEKEHDEVVINWGDIFNPKGGIK